MERPLKIPKFSERKELVRYVSELNRHRDGRPAAAAFLPDPPSGNPKADYLSVNSLEVESLKEVAAYHRAKWQGNRGKVALSSHKVSHYTDAGRKCGIQIQYDRDSSTWQFSNGRYFEVAYKHHPVLGSDRLNSISHCGVEFTRALKDQNAAAKFARRMTGSRFHLLWARDHEVERDLILETLKHCLGNRTHAANILGISIRTLRNKLNEYAHDGAPIPPPGGGEMRGAA
jgi:DNA-binding protein Fis